MLLFVVTPCLMITVQPWMGWIPIKKKQNCNRIKSEVKMNQLVSSRLQEKIRGRQQTLKFSKMIWNAWCFFWNIEFLTFIIPRNLFSISILGKPLDADKNIKIPTSSQSTFSTISSERKTIIFFLEREDASKVRQKSNCHHKFGNFEIQCLF